MKLFRRMLVIRVLTIFLLLLFIQSIILPVELFALTTGPFMPEYTSYESPGATDMVNIATGDFSFSLPVLEVPGPEGNFSLPLSYNAGIGLDQEASWVGLGWTMNAGAITRTISGFPDDANGDTQSVTVQDLTGLRGWNANILGIGNMGWNNQQGHFGSLSLLNIVNAEWGNGKSYVGVLGINVSNHGLDFDPIQFGSGILTLLSWGVASEASTGSTIAKEVAKDAIGRAVSSGAFALASNSGLPNAPASGYWEYSKQNRNRLLLLGLSTVAKDYKIWLDQTRYEKMFGLMYLGNVPNGSYTRPDTIFSALALTLGGNSRTLSMFPRTTGTVNQGSASDINYFPDPNQQDFWRVNNPVVLAPDNFIVRASGISGSIAPYRLEIGSVSMPREMTGNHIRLAPVKYITNDPSLPNSPTNYKVPFVYKGQLSNDYFHHVGSASAVTAPSNYFGLSTTYANSPDGGITPSSLTFILNDVIFENQRIRSDIPSTKRIPQSDYVEWLSNSEITGSMTYPSKFIDFLSGGTGTTISTSSDRYLFRTQSVNNGLSTTSSSASFNHLAIPVPSYFIGNVTAGTTIDLYVSFYNDQQSYLNGTTSNYQEFKNKTVTSVDNSGYTFRVDDTALASFDAKYANIEIKIITNPQTPNGFGAPTSLGGFCITGSDGTTYHFALPIYDYEQYSEVHEISDPVNKRSVIKRPAGFANTWVLTAITGSDYIDKNQNGLADDNDWGYWVKFNYGLQTSQYVWRLPYSGFNAEGGNGTQESYSTGKKQLIYLNSIETRSHVALFLKNFRNDGKSAAPDANNNYITPLRLEEIALVSKENYKKLVSIYNIPEFSNQLLNVCFSSQFSVGARNFLNLNCLKRVIFNYDYTLCNNTLNSNSGKLTLSGVSIRGRNDIKAVPDYKFEYNNNPNYTAGKWDGWGMFNTGVSHVADQPTADASGSAWSLSKITTPLGSEILINYERDTYSTVCGNGITELIVGFDNSNTSIYYPTGLPVITLPINHNGTLHTGDRVWMDGQISYSCPGVSFSNKQLNANGLKIVSTTMNSVTFDQPFMDVSNCNFSTSGQSVAFTSYAGHVNKYYDAKKGDGLRVASLITRSESGVQNKIRYLYSNDDGVVSSGVIAQEPPYEIISLRTQGPLPPGYPNTPVIYGKVTVLNGKLADDNDYHSKQVYEFETPDLTQYTLNQNVIQNLAPLNYRESVSVYENKMVDRSNRIGTLKSIKIFDKPGSLYSSSTMTYTDQILNKGVNNYQGIYSGGALMFDRVVGNTGMVYKLNRTTILQYPYTLQKVINSKDGFTSEVDNLSWDFLTGAVDQKLDRSPLGIYLTTLTKPAYVAYPELGPKANDINNRNMLSQNASTYVYASDVTGHVYDAGNANGQLVSATAQTWRKDWNNYRHYDGTNYSETQEAISVSNPVWRKGSSYIWRGNYSRKQANGAQTFALGDEFNFSGANSLWQYTGEQTRFDHYGMPLESKDLNGIYSSVKMGYDNRIQFASASNAQYNEIAFSSAEDEIPGIGYFGGEVAVKSAGGNAVVVKKSSGNVGADAHTGDCALSLSVGYGFIYKPTVLTPNRTYRASVWANSASGQIYYKLNGGAENTSLSTPVLQGKSGWYQLNLPIPVGSTFTSLEVGVKGTGTAILYDDFRFQPADAEMTCHVSNPADFQYTAGMSTVSYVLDNNNLYTKYETTEDGHVNRVYSESIKFTGEKLVTESKSNYRRANINQ